MYFNDFRKNALQISRDFRVFQHFHVQNHCIFIDFRKNALQISRDFRVFQHVFMKSTNLNVLLTRSK